MRIFLALAFLFCLHSVANAESVQKRKIIICDSVENIFNAVRDDYEEVPIWWGEDIPTPSHYVITANKTNDSWTLIQFDEVQACVLGVGTGSKLPILGKSS